MTNGSAASWTGQTLPDAALATSLKAGVSPAPAWRRIGRAEWLSGSRIQPAGFAAVILTAVPPDDSLYHLVTRDHAVDGDVAGRSQQPPGRISRAVIDAAKEIQAAELGGAPFGSGMVPEVHPV
jgi:hypothetical protein